MTALSERAHIVAWKAALDTPLGQWAAYDYNELPATLPKIYVLLTVSRRFGGDPRNTGRRPITGWRLTTLAVGTKPDEARWAREMVAGALNEARNSTLGTSLVTFESENQIEADGGLYSGLTVWTYTTLA